MNTLRNTASSRALPDALSVVPGQATPSRPQSASLSRRSDHCRGVTLLELVLVLVLVATMAAVAVSRRSTIDLDPYADGEALKGALRTTRTRAMADIVPWSFVVAGQTGTFQRDGVTRDTVAFLTAGVAAGTITFDTRGVPSGTLSFAVLGYSGSPVTVTAQTGFIP